MLQAFVQAGAVNQKAGLKDPNLPCALKIWRESKSNSPRSLERDLDLDRAGVGNSQGLEFLHSPVDSRSISLTAIAKDCMSFCHRGVVPTEN